jgi:hypothetical protein
MTPGRRLTRVLLVNDPLPFGTRLWFAWVCFFRVLFDGVFAGQVYLVAQRGLPAGPPEPKFLGEAKGTGGSDGGGAGKADAEAALETTRGDLAAARQELETAKKQLDAARKAEAPKPTHEAALQLLALLQREGRLVDFLEEDVASFADADIGAAARVVHAGCRKALRDHVKLAPVRDEAEGAKVSLPEGFDPSAVKLTGDVQGKGPFTGTLRHRGWRATVVSMPVAVPGHDARIVAQAEVEL